MRVGDDITFHISNSRSYFEVFVFREGAERRLMHVLPGLRGALQPVPEDGYREGFGWKPTVTYTIPQEWPSGIYVASFASGQGPREMIFVVRPLHPRAPLLLTIAVNTYQAYNTVGGKCFYDYISTDRSHSTVLSLDRPYPPDLLGNFYGWDQFFVSWLEASGYEIDFCVNGDHDSEPGLLASYRANLRIGHDEYNSRIEAEQLQAFVRAGGNLLLFSGNAFCKEVEYREGQRQLYCAQPWYQDFPTPERPETSYLSYIDDLRQRTIGVFYTSFVHAKTDVPGVMLAPVTGEYGFYRVARPEHWAFDGTGLQAGDEFGREDSIVGGEADAADLVFDGGIPRYTGVDGVSTEFRILAIGDAMVPHGGWLTRYGTDPQPAPAYATVAINESEFKGTIFNAATIDWAHGLYRGEGVVDRITRNVLDRLAV